jgi:hypothetical protein
MGMNPEIKAQWVADLRSGEFEQGTGRLNRDGKLCCLGVLCEQAADAGVTDRAIGDRETLYSGLDNVLPYTVTEWAGLPESNPKVTYVDDDHGEGVRSLAALNDGAIPDARKRTFAEIADLIEGQL